MSLLNRKTEPATAHATPEALALFKAPAIQEKLAAAEAKFAELSHQHQEAALNSLSDAPGDHAALATIEAELRDSRRNVATLKAAHSAALKRDEIERRRLLADHNKTIIRVCKSHLAARDAAAEALSASLREAIEHFKVMVERGAKAKAAVPTWGLVRGRQVEPDELSRLVQKEIARLYGAPNTLDGECPFPGGETFDFRMKLQPEKLSPLADVLREATAGVIENLTGKVIE